MTATWRGPDPGASLGATVVDHQGEVDGEYWRLVTAFSVGEPGEYTVFCGDPSDGQRYAVAHGEDGAATTATILSVFVAGGAPVLLGFLLGATVELVTLTRRRRLRAHLLRQRTGSPPPHR
ncbi:hypothetical protein J4H86_01880 [Spiractinospora alimapuensis]|uniref:hypothetical protein n=1 Tax=Spiractinospora alimapuensis TaxID=2820884 RepID=UPI001F3E2157|nr:hypothetical protein [Spiractinospora alimapuensis]QVQ52613.1 hypothetical protein J4H86_01880 [Spiractinospora alimapuensis]